ncbi:Rhamnosidase A [Thermobacillus xylanilyticus]|uniref:alpha-L-rhamnosidase n=1 Tax=Thermobacillus xylanilyticus TaxID=76633 RepID=A0ABM8V2U1_THEXY|nr:alpha-L-rhamnosidase [Thermobacillus xylanilyticus]CAG5082569.1 Rhamnosidase A [Thermobacillus xylanilyticus]
MANLIVTDLTCEYRTNPLGIGVRRPRFSWKLEGGRRGILQQAYRLAVAAEDGDFDRPIWDSGRVESGESVLVEYGGPELASRTKYVWRVKVWDDAGREAASEPAVFETTLLELSEWRASWITPAASAIDPQTDAAFLLRKSFRVKGGVKAARIYATAAGVYELYVNGQRVSDEELSPGWTSYQYRLQYQTYDVTELLKSGDNAVGIHLGDGWYRSGMGFEQLNYKYGDRRAALLQLHIRYEDGTEEMVATDASWRAATGPVTYSTIYNGETYDARLERKGWSEAGYADDDWAPAETIDLPMDILVPQENWPVRVTETIRPIAFFVTPAGDKVLDMGQNMVGRIRFTVEAPAGTTIVLRHAEVLDKDGNIYFGNLRFAKQTVTYIAKGEGKETYAPRFTFLGFRYVKVEGWPGDELPLDAFVGEVMHSDMPRTGDFSCSDERVNQLQRNIQWGQRGNFVDVPTDCPQRDERLGWTGDAQVFIATALYNFNGGPFFTKWLRDLKAEQRADGGVPFVIPDVADGHSSSGWGDAAVICPWTVYRYYGDRRLLAEQYDSMKAWVEYIRAQGDNEYMWETGFHFGDWVALDAKEGSYVGATPLPLVATAYYAYSSRLLSEAARVLGRDDEAAKYGELHARVVQAFRDEFITKTGRMASPTQTAHVLALAFDLAGDAAPRIARDLNDLIIENGYHLTTGFLGTPYLCMVLSDHGYHDTAMRLLLQDGYPGWLYSISKGATTIWEHWDGIKPDGTFWSDDMNSFNHYAYGAVGEWMYRKVAGLDMDGAVPGFKRLHIEPLFGAGLLSRAKTSHLSMYGKIETAWSIDGNRVQVQVSIPANTTARVVLRGAAVEGLSIDGQPVGAGGSYPAGVQSIAATDRGVEAEIGSGEYRFAYEAVNLFRKRYTTSSRLLELLTDERAERAVRRHMPHLFGSPSLNFLRTSTLRELAENGMSRVTREMVERVLEELAEEK